VINALTGEPLKKADVQLQRGGGGPGGGGDDGGAGQQAITTTEDGKFAFPQVAPGRYSIRVSRTGFTRQGSGWTSSVTPQAQVIQVAKGQSVTGVAVRLVPQGVISGRILDEDGDPVQRVNVAAYRYTYPGGRRTLSHISGSPSNDLGEYRIWGLTPGVYYVSATPPDMSGPPMMQQQRRRTGEAYATTYFPNADTADRATPLEIGPGSQILNTDVRLRRSRLFQISGVVVDQSSGNASNRAAVQVIPVNMQGDAGRVSGARVQEGGKFNIRGLAAGSYLIRAQLFGEGRGPGGGASATGVTRVELNSEDINGVQVVVQPNGTLQASIKIDGGDTAAPATTPNIRVSLESTTQGFANGMAGGASRENSKFTIANVASDRYRIRIGGVPQGFYVRDVQLGNQDVRFTGLDFTAGGGAQSGELTITLAASPGSLEGTVKDSKDQAIGSATVVLMPKEEWTGLTEQIKTATTGVQGEFQFANLAPGEYRVLAFEEIENGAWFDPEVRKRFDNEAKSVKVEKGTATKQELRAAKP